MNLSNHWVLFVYILVAPVQSVDTLYTAQLLNENLCWSTVWEWRQSKMISKCFQLTSAMMLILKITIWSKSQAKWQTPVFSRTLSGNHSPMKPVQWKSEVSLPSIRGNILSRPWPQHDTYYNLKYYEVNLFQVAQI